MPDSQEEACKYNHDSIENHELDLLVRELPGEAFAQLDGSEDGSNKQARGRTEESCNSH